MPAANSNSRPSASVAPRGVSSLDFDGRLSDWSAVAFVVDDEEMPLTGEDRIFMRKLFGGIALIWIAGFSALFLGA
jgi:hypothetical protein